MSLMFLQFQTISFFSYGEFDLWPVYSGERFRVSWPSCLLLSFEDNLSKIIWLDVSCEYQVLFSLKNNEKIFMNVVCCSRAHDWRFKSLS